MLFDGKDKGKYADMGFDISYNIVYSSLHGKQK
jgi:hypothetical protein